MKTSNNVLAGIVAGWWLLLGAAVVWVMSEQAVSALPTSFATAESQVARINHPGPIRWVIPVNRVGFDAFKRGIREGDQSAIEEAYEASEWIEATHGQAVRIVTRDGSAIQIELLEGAYTGRRAWLTMGNLTPVN
jgi:hypothetical protein